MLRVHTYIYSGIIKASVGTTECVGDYFHRSLAFPGPHPRPWWTPLRPDWRVQAGRLGSISSAYRFSRSREYMTPPY